MNEDQFSAMLAIIVPPIIEQITKTAMWMMKRRFPAFISPSSIRSFRMKIKIVALQPDDAVYHVSR